MTFRDIYDARDAWIAAHDGKFPSYIYVPKTMAEDFHRACVTARASGRPGHVILGCRIVESTKKALTFS